MRVKRGKKKEMEKMKLTSAFFAVVLMIFVLAEIFPLAVGVEEESENFTVLISTGGLDKEDG